MGPIPAGAMSEALELQARACEGLGSPFTAQLLDDLRQDHDAGGLVSDLLHQRSERPVHDAIPLRLLGVLHRLVLRGEAPALAACYPSAGGDGRRVPIEAVLDVLRTHRDEIDRALGEQVQTNEVGRAAALVIGFAAISRWTGLPLRILEIGASAGLNLRWDHFCFDTGVAVVGEPASPVRFEGVWTRPPDLSGLTAVVERRGADLAPIDPTDAAARERLLSFVWPDQHERFVRLQAALAVAARVPVTIDQADAGDWLAEQLVTEQPGVTTVVYHSIVWQYLGSATRDAVRAALSVAGERSTADRPLAWLRLEPAGPVADLRLTTWPGGEERILATSGYHGADVTPR